MFTYFTDPLLCSRSPMAATLRYTYPPILSVGHCCRCPPMCGHPSFLPQYPKSRLGPMPVWLSPSPLEALTRHLGCLPTGMFPHHTWASASCAILLLPCAVLSLLPYPTQFWSPALVHHNPTHFLSASHANTYFAQPYLMILGIPCSGKKRLGKAVSYIDFKP